MPSFNGAPRDRPFAFTPAGLDARRFPFLFAHRAFILAEIFALAAALSLLLLRGATLLAPGVPGPMIRLSSLSSLSIFSRIATASLSCWRDNSATGLAGMEFQ